MLTVLVMTRVKRIALEVFLKVYMKECSLKKILILK